MHVADGFGKRIPKAKSVSLIAALLISADVAASAGWQSLSHQIRDLNGGPVACIVHIPETPGSTPALDRLAVDIRVPSAPGQLVDRLPAGRRDYSALPITVFLIPAPPKGQATTARLAQIVPLSANLNPRRLGLFADDQTDTFVRVEYARASLQPGVDLVAERSAVTDGGERITSQTRCRIGIIDALVWR